MKREKGSKSLRFIKSLEDIERMSNQGKAHKESGKRTIFHSSGKGGGLWVHNLFIEKYFGSTVPIWVEFSRYCPYYTEPPDSMISRKLWKYEDQQLYGEWLSRVVPNYLEDELFEI